MASIENSLAGVVKQAVQMAAEAHRVNDGIYHSASSEITPLEGYMAENGGFDEVEGGLADVGLEPPDAVEADGGGAGGNEL